jgi:hypothetical protein
MDEECQAYIFPIKKSCPKKMDRFDPNGSKAAFSFSVPYFKNK